MSDRVAVFHQGRIQQIDTPTALYERPANAFVAQFIGENNCMPGRVLAVDADRCRVELADGVQVEAMRVAPLQPGDATRLSLRPERVRIAPDRPMHTQVAATVVDVTYLGRYARVRLRACGLDEFIVTLPNDGRGLALENGARVDLGWNVADCRALDSA